MYEEKEIKYKKRRKEKVKHKNKNRFQLQQPKKRNKPDFLDKINWKALFLKLFILFIIMIFIIFIISRINKNVTEKNKVLNDNMNKIINAALLFYNDKNLPNNIGDSTSQILDELMKNNYLEPIKDQNNKECIATNSYVIVTKLNKKEYKLKAYLSCEKQNKTKIVTITCSKNCQIKNSSK